MAVRSCHWAIIKEDSMSAYVIALIDVTNPAGYEEYKPLAAAAVEQFGGRYIARGGRREVLEGDIDVARIALLEFPDMNSAMAWYKSPEYQRAAAIRQANSNSSLLVVEGS
jgi:uncharacterized protein (DUF1330 family)